LYMIEYLKEIDNMDGKNGMQGAFGSGSSGNNKSGISSSARKSTSSDVKVKSAEDMDLDWDYIPTDTEVDDIFPEGCDGVPMGDITVLIGIHATGKSTFAVHVGRKGYEMSDGKKKCLYITTETINAIKGIPEFTDNPQAFDIAEVVDLEDVDGVIKDNVDKFGIEYNSVVIDSISEPGESDKYDTLRDYGDRADHYKSIKETLKKAINQVGGVRDPFAVISIGHLGKTTRLDSEMEYELIEPKYHKGELRKAYKMSGSTPVGFRYLASHILVFMDESYIEYNKRDDVHGKDAPPSVVRVSPYKGRSSSKFDYRKFRIKDDGVVEDR